MRASIRTAHKVPSRRRECLRELLERFCTKVHSPGCSEEILGGKEMRAVPIVVIASLSIAAASTMASAQSVNGSVNAGIGASGANGSLHSGVNAGINTRGATKKSP